MYCPSCRGEFREGIEMCPSCEATLVATLPDIDVIQAEDETVAVGLGGQHASLQVVEIEGRKIDRQKAFTYDVGSELVRDLEQDGIPSVLRPLEGVAFRGDPRPHYEVHVRPDDAERAAATLSERWARMASEEVGARVDASDIEKCPACGAAVPLSAEECPDCGLGIGSALDDEDDAEGEDEDAPA